MNEERFNPHVRFIRRRHLTRSYSARVCAFDYRLFYVVRGGLEAEMEGRTIRLDPTALLLIPPGVGYRLLLRDASAIIYIVNFDFDSARIIEPARPPASEEAFDPAEILSHFCIPPFGEVVCLPRAPELEELLGGIDAAESMGEAARHARSGLMKYLLCRVKHLLETPVMGAADARMQTVKAYIDAHYAEPLNNRTVAREMGYHPHYLNACFLRAEGITLHAYLERVRMGHAKELLLTTQRQVSEIAQACGFPEPSYFVKFFSRHVGMTPKQYRGLGM